MMTCDFRDACTASLSICLFCLTMMTFDSFLIFFIENFTCVAVFIISDDELFSTALLEQHVIETLELIPNRTKLVVSASKFKSLSEVPETLHVRYDFLNGLLFFTRMIEIFNKRWQTLDLISMMQELKRTHATRHRCGFYSMKENLSTLPKFQQKEEEHSL